jgi:hypothetical protein
MHYKDVAPSYLPSLMLPCPYCGHRMEIAAVTPALYPNRAPSNDLEDITHTCVQCGATLTRTRRPFTSTPTPERTRYPDRFAIRTLPARGERYDRCRPNRCPCRSPGPPPEAGEGTRRPIA